jgi:diguanylate cyclase (GGDEF)-like protein
MAIRRVPDRDGRARRPRRLEIDIAAGAELTKRLSITDVDDSSLRAIAERFRVLVERSRVTANGQDLQVTISIGGAIAEVGDTAETLFERADAALDRAKEGGRNRVVLAGHPEASAP